MITADSVETAQLHFSFIAYPTVLVTEGTVRRVFLNFGHVQDVTIKKTSTKPKTGEQTGYGFVHFPLTDAGIHSAICGAKVIRQVHIDNVLYDCRLAWSLEEIIRRKQSSQNMHQMRMTNSANKPHEPCMYVPELRGISSARVPSNLVCTPDAATAFSCFQLETTSSCPPIQATHLRPIKRRSTTSNFPEISLASLSSSSISSQMSGFTDSTLQFLSFQERTKSDSFSCDEREDLAHSMNSPSISQGRIPPLDLRKLRCHSNQLF